MMLHVHAKSAVLLMVLSALGCSDRTTPSEPVSSGPLFRAVPADSSGITFANRITETPQLNYFTYIYAYNGGGVSVGDIDNDGLPDLYFSGNQEPDRLYRNLGGLRFADITDQALRGARNGWSTGVTMADVNGDGWLDIHVCRSGPSRDTTITRDLLYINDGTGSFDERAAEWGIADTSHATQAAFFDHDHDGDLDMYLMVHPPDRVKGESNFSVLAAVKEHRAPTDRLYRNDGGHFTDVTYAANVQNYSFGLGLAVADLDRDGWQDIYVSNDFDVPDLMYINDHQGGFTESLQWRTRHISWFSMGCDVADMDNDAEPDIMVLDMTAPDHLRSKTNMGGMSPAEFWMLVRGGYFFQYMVNTLQRNNGNGTFSEIAQMAGVARTDWSWAPLFADLDNDGYKDLLVTNGFKHDIRNNDYQRKVYDTLRSGDDFYRTLDLVPSTRLRNYLYRNNGDLSFADSSQAWGFTTAVNSNGAAYADLDNDGDLDLVINNLDDIASVFENTATTARPENHHLRIALTALPGRTALGAQVELHIGDAVQYQELSPTRGYQSCVEPILHFGLGQHSTVDELIVLWPGGGEHGRTVLKDVRSDQVLRLDQRAATAMPPKAPLPKPFFTETTSSTGPEWAHEENDYDDFQLEVLLPHQQSALGPMVAGGDVNGDGRDDLFAGASHGHSPVLWIQQANGKFVRANTQPWSAHAAQEQVGGHFFDADKDGDQDLLVLAGSNEHDIRDAIFTQRLYRNDGKGNFSEMPDAFPEVVTSALRADAADIDNDGDMDLYIGGRTTPGHYPFAPRSYLLLNDGTGHFSDATAERAPSLMGPGLVTDVLFTDLDSDGDADLLLTGEWMHPMVALNTGGHFTDASAELGLAEMPGWWYSVSTADVNGDGLLDILAGNLGWNSKFHGTKDHPIHIYWGDFDDNGRSDIVLAKESDGKLLPVRGRECSSQQCPMILGKFGSYDAFANADLPAIYSPEKLKAALHLQASYMRSTVLLNRGAKGFEAVDLPPLAQASPINAILPMDVNGDGITDLVVAGNAWGAEVETVRYDGGTGLVLIGDGTGRFEPVPIRRSGFVAWENAKDMTTLRTPSGPLIVVANNNGPLRTFLLSGPITGQAAK